MMQISIPNAECACKRNQVSNARYGGMHISFRSHDTRERSYTLYFAHHGLMGIDLRKTA